jgi:hypothetical protein
VNLVLLPDAAAEAEDAAAFYEGRREGLGTRFLVSVDDAIARALVAPYRNPPWSRGSDVRRTRVKRFPYLVYYLIEANQLVVVAIAATAQRPGYWLSRLDP